MHTPAGSIRRVRGFFAGFRFLEQDKVDVVKMTMQDNIQQMLANEERLDQISENAENLNEQVSRSGLFSRRINLRYLLHTQDPLSRQDVARERHPRGRSTRTFTREV